MGEKLQFGKIFLLVIFIQNSSIVFANEACHEILNLLATKSQQLSTQAAEWGKRWGTLDGAKDNASHLLFKSSPGKNPNEKFWGFVTQIDNPQNLKWHQNPFQKFGATYLSSKSQSIAADGASITHAQYLSIFNGLDEATLRLPNHLLVKPVSRLVSGKEVELNLPALLTAYYFSGVKLAETLDDKTLKKFDDLIEAQSAELDDLMKYDFRYKVFQDIEKTLISIPMNRLPEGDLRHFKALAEAGKLTPHEKRRMVFLHKRMLDRYYQQMADLSQEMDEEKVHNAFMDSPMYWHITDFIKDSRIDEKCFRRLAKQNGAPNDAQLRAIFRNQQVNLELQFLIPYMAKAYEASRKQRLNQNLNAEDLKALKDYSDLRNNPSRASLIGEYAESPYVKTLLILHDRESIDWKELQFRLGENAEYSRKFEDYEILGVKRLQMNALGECIDKDLELGDIQKISMLEISKAFAAKKAKTRGPSSIQSPDGSGELKHFKALWIF